MLKTKLYLFGVLSVVIGLLAGSAADEDAIERQLALKTVLTTPEIVVQLDQHEVKVGEKVRIRDFVFVEDRIPAPRTVRRRVVRVGFYHRRLKKMVYDNPERGVDVLPHRDNVFGRSFSVFYTLDHPSYSYFTDERRGHEDDFVVAKPGVYLIFVEWYVKHPKWGEVVLEGGPALLIVNPPHHCHADDTTDPRFYSDWKFVESGEEVEELKTELEDLYDRRSQSWKEHENKWK